MYYFKNFLIRTQRSIVSCEEKKNKPESLSNCIYQIGSPDNFFFSLTAVEENHNDRSDPSLGLNYFK